ncbi:MAG: response regulator [Planctomycetes bacterium]|nr:response regulator [Planctomycetota bacterium]
MNDMTAARKPNVLIVDDMPANLYAMERILSGLDAELFKADSGNEALKLTIHHEFALILLDVQMPVMDGYEVAALLREREATAVIPIIFVTAIDKDEQHTLRGYETGAVDYIFKPVNSDILRSKVNVFLELHSRHMELNQEIVRREQVEEKLEEMLERERQASRELAETARKAEAANRTKSEFLAKMSHELRTPLNSIIGFTELMIDDANDPPGKKRARRLEKVHRNSKNLLALINDILDLSKIEADRLTLDLGEVDVAAVVQECAESIRPIVQGDCVELRCRVDETVTGGFHWTGDTIRLRQIITNLLSNAAKFTESGQIELRVKADAGSLVIEVQDTGIGIAMEHLSAIFDEFEQVDSSSTRRAGGTGLGLSICRKLCKLMGGHISAASTLGVGSCFTVTLPIQEAQAPLPDTDFSQDQDEPGVQAIGEHV